MSNTVTEAGTSISTETSAAAPTTTGRPASSYGAAPHDPSKPPVKRQIVCFSFYKVMPEWRRLPAEEKAAHKAAFAEVLTRWNKPGEFVSLTYSTIGTRGDVDMCVWSIGYGVDELNQMRSELMRTPLGGYLNSPHNFLAMTKRSQYQIDRPDESEGEGRGAIRPGGQKYIFIYPFWKTRPWYLLSAAERKRLMDEHIRIGLMYPRVKLNTTYSFGIDDQEFVVAFETNFPEDFLDLVQQLRETEISLYTLEGHADLQLCARSGCGDAGPAGIARAWRRLRLFELLRRLRLCVGAKARAIAESEPVAAKKKTGKTAESAGAGAGGGDSGCSAKDVSRGGVCAESYERVGTDGGYDSVGAVHRCPGESGDSEVVQGVSYSEGDGCCFPARA